MTLVKFFSTSHIVGAWPADPILYPTYSLLLVSLISLCVDLLHLGARYCGTASARKADFIASKGHYIISVIQVIATATSTGIFNATKTAGSAKDLFGWSCSSAADQFADVNSSDLVCSTNVSPPHCMLSYPVLHRQLTHPQQTTSSYISIAQTCLHVLSILITVVGMLGPKDSNTQEGSKPSKGDEAPLLKTLSMSSRKPEGTEEPADDQAPLGDEAKLKEPQLDSDAIANLIKQIQAL